MIDNFLCLCFKTEILILNYFFLLFQNISAYNQYLLSDLFSEYFYLDKNIEILKHNDTNDCRLFHQPISNTAILNLLFIVYSSIISHH